MLTRFINYRSIVLAQPTPYPSSCQTLLFNLFSPCTFKASAYGSKDGILTEEIMDERVKEAVRQHKQKEDWRLAPAPGSSSPEDEPTMPKFGKV